jgi:hypothetical protein
VLSAKEMGDDGKSNFPLPSCIAVCQLPVVFFFFLCGWNCECGWDWFGDEWDCLAMVWSLGLVQEVVASLVDF